MERFAKIANIWKLFTIFAKRSNVGKLHHTKHVSLLKRNATGKWLLKASIKNLKQVQMQMSILLDLNK